MLSFLETVFWTCLLVLVWAHAGLPLLAAGVARLRRNRVRAAPFTPRVTVVVVAREWDPDLLRRLGDVLALDYPQDRLELLVAPSAQAARLGETVARLRDPRVRLVANPGQGVAAARNAAAARASGDVLVFPEPAQVFHPEALRHLVRCFADPRVGAAFGSCAALCSHDGEDATLRAERWWEAWDRWLVGLESHAGNAPPVHGTLWAIRRELHDAVPRGRNPDFTASARVVEQGYRLVHEPRALTWERTGDAAERFRRRVERGRGALRSIEGLPGILSPLRHGFWSLALSARLLRWSSPVLVVAWFLSAALLSSRGAAYGCTAAGLLLLAALAALAWVWRGSRRVRTPFLAVPLFLGLSAGAASIALVTAVLPWARSATRHGATHPEIRTGWTGALPSD